MTTKNHTPIATGAAANASTFNTPLGSLDAKMGDVASVTTHTGSPAVQTPDLAAAINALDAQKLESGASAALITNTPTGNVTQETVQLAINQLDTIKQPLDTDLTAIAALSPSDDDVLQRKSGEWTNRTPALLKADMGLTADDVANVPTATITSETVQAAIAELDADKAALSHTHTVSQITNVTSVKLDDFAAPEDNTDLDVSTNTHGLFPKLVSDAMQLFNGVGSWVKWAMGIKAENGAIFTPRKYLQFRGAGVVLEDDVDNDGIKVTISGGGAGAVADLNDLADVDAGSPANNDVLAYDHVNDIWVNKSPAVISTQGHVILNEGAILASKNSINFVGSGVEVTNDDANNWTQVTVLGSNQNYLLNGGFDLAQRQAAATLTEVLTDKYAADRWRVSFGTAGLQYVRVANAGETGIRSQFYGEYKKITGAGKFAVYQIVEGVNTIPLRGKVVTFTVKVKASVAKTLKMAILKNTGTADVIPATMITAINADGVNPTFGASLSIITSADSYTSSAAWVEITATKLVPSDANNLVCILWTDYGFSINDILYVAEAGLYNASSPPVWDPRPIAQEIPMCQRYYEKSYAIDVKPGTGASLGYVEMRQSISGVITTVRLYVPFQTLKRSTPTVRSYDNTATALAGYCQMYNVSAVLETAKRAATVPGMSPHGAIIQLLTAASVQKTGMLAHFTAESEL